MPFKKGNPGRPKGIPNKDNRVWRALVVTLCSDEELLTKLREECMRRPELLFKAAEHAFGKPRQSLDLNLGERHWLQWPDREDVKDE